MGHEPLKNHKEPLIKKSKFSDAHFEAAKSMAETLQLRRPPKLEKWAEVFRLMEERDGIPTDEAMAMFSWANRDDFWRQNILSPDKLRQKWDQLEAKRSNRKANSTDLARRNSQAVSNDFKRSDVSWIEKN